MSAMFASATPHVSGVKLQSLAHLFGDEPIYCIRRKGQFEPPSAARFRKLVTSRPAANCTV
jgi:hypothetical protein